MLDVLGGRHEPKIACDRDGRCSDCLTYLVAADADGSALYSKKCAMCHGADGVAKATAKGSANFNDPAWQKKARTKKSQMTSRTARTR
jgi:mono/diheme cytochrome c family protein